MSDGSELRSDFQAKLQAAYEMSVNASIKLAGLGDECEIWRLETTRGELAVRLSPPWRNATQLRRSHRLVTFVATRMPEAVAPLSTEWGETLLEWGGRAAAVFPWIEGDQLARERPELRDAAARLLARLHKAMLLWPEAESTLAVSRIEPDRQDLADSDLDSKLSEIYAAGDTVRGPIHGDYYRRNLICRGERIVGVVDWDDSHEDLLMQELAWAVWEFAQHPIDGDLQVGPARAFLASYHDEGGPVPSGEYANIVSLIRKRLREEVRQAAAAAVRGEPIDQAYTDREIAAFSHLRLREIEW